MHKSLSKYLSESKVLQIATVGEGKPWVCTVYFVVDEELNIYWLSEPNVRHSKNIETNSSVALTMAIKTDLPVIGLSAEGKVKIVKDLETVEMVMKKYIAKYNEGKQFVDRFKKGINKHHLYKFTPDRYVLFDEVNYPNDGSKNMKLSIKNE
jgi:uncharacterized protein YhbP (UPF0306 family)